MSHTFSPPSLIISSDVPLSKASGTATKDDTGAIKLVVSN